MVIGKSAAGTTSSHSHKQPASAAADDGQQPSTSAAGLPPPPPPRPPLRIVPDGQETALLLHHYQICDLIEKGPICTVYRAVHKASGRNCSIKSLDLKRYAAVSGLSQEDAEKEVEICTALTHSFFVQLNDVISGNNALHMVFEWVDGQDICFEIVRRAAAGFIYSEAVAAHYGRQLVQAVQHMHSQHILHRDIRPHNLLLANKENNAPLKVRGLGLACRLPSEHARCTAGRIGVPQFMAPEVAAGRGYGKPADMWSVGVVLFVLLSGRLPFVGRPADIFRQIESAQFSFHDSAWNAISGPAKDLVRRLLQLDERERLSPGECLRHEWLARKQVPQRVHLMETIENIRRYNQRRRLKSNIVSAVNRASAFSSSANGNRLAASSPGSCCLAARSLAGGDSCDFECLPPSAGNQQRSPLDGAAGGVESVLASLDQISVLTDLTLPLQRLPAGSPAEDVQRIQQVEEALSDQKLHRHLLLYDQIRTEAIRPGPANRRAERCLREARKELLSIPACAESAELLDLLGNIHLQAILQAQEVTMEEVYAAASTSIPSSSATTTPAADGAEASAGLRREDAPLQIGPSTSAAAPAGLPNGSVCTGQPASSQRRQQPEPTSIYASGMPRPPPLATLEQQDFVLAGDDDDLVLNAVSRVRLVQFTKDTEEPMGITLKITEDGRCYVGRIMHGGLIHRQATLHVDDEILEINGVQVADKSVEQLQRLLRDARGPVTFKIVPSYRSAPPTCEIFVRAQFDYDPAQDDLIPSANAGVPFRTGDVLQVISKDDHNWWQARFVSAFPALGGSKWSSSCATSASGTLCAVANAVASTSSAALSNHTGAIGVANKRHPPQNHQQPAEGGTSAANMAGLIPSPELQEWRTACLAMERARENSHCFKLGGKKKGPKYYTTKYLRKHSELFDGMEMISYEEVIRLPTFRRKTLVLLGAHGVGRRHIKNTLIRLHPHRFAYPIPHTTRPPRRDEIDGKHYFFVSNDQMLQDIAANEYLEYGTHEECLYGTKLETIRAIHRTGKMAILDVEPQALKVLRNAEYAPFVVFIGAPDLHGLEDPDGSLERLVKESDMLRQSFGHLFDFILVNNDIDETIRQLETVVEKLAAIPQWVPVSWVY